MASKFGSWWRQSRPHSWWMKISQHPLVASVIMIVLIALALAVYKFGWDWTGFNGGYSKVTTTNSPQGITTVKEQSSAKTLWDWLQLLIVPIILAIGGFWLNQMQKSREQRTIKKQAKLERELTNDNQKET